MKGCGRGSAPESGWSKRRWIMVGIFIQYNLYTTQFETPFMVGRAGVGKGAKEHGVG